MYSCGKWLFELNILLKHTCRCRGGLTSSRLCANNDSFQWPIAFKIFLMCVNMNKAGFRIVAIASGGCSALVSYENAYGSRSHFPGNSILIFVWLSSTFHCPCFPGLVIQSSVFSNGQQIPQGFLKKTRIHKPTLVPVKLIEKAFSMMQNADLQRRKLRWQALR